MSEITIRPISPQDFESFHACLDAVARERLYLGFVEAPTIERTRQWLGAAIERGEIRLLALDGQSVGGWCDIEITGKEGSEHSGKLGMGVLAECRGQGVGRALLDRALEEARIQLLERMELDVCASNSVAIAIYERRGFQIEGRKRRARKIDGRYDDILVMALLF